MIQGFNTKCFHVEYEAPRIALQATECVVLLMEIKEGGAKATIGKLCTILTYHCRSLVFEIFASSGWFHTILSIC